MATVAEDFGSDNNMTVTNLHSLASSATAGWQSAVVDNRTNKYLDIELLVELEMANTAPGSDKAVYIYVYGSYHDGSNWHHNNNASGSEGTITITNPNNLILAKILTYQTADELLKSGGLFLAQLFGGHIPEGWGVVIINYTGAAIYSSGSMVRYKGYKETIA